MIITTAWARRRKQVIDLAPFIQRRMKRRWMSLSSKDGQPVMHPSQRQVVRLPQSQIYPSGWSEKHLFGKCNVLISQKLPYDTKTLYTKFEFDMWSVGIRVKSLKFWKWYGVKKQNFQFSLFLGSERCAWMRGFQIWSLNWTRMTFDHLFGQKTVENTQKLAK